MTDSVIKHADLIHLPQRGPANVLTFHDNKVLVITAGAVGLYRDLLAVTDPFGNRLLGVEPIPEALRASWHPQTGFVREQVAGHVALHSGAVLFLRPDGVALYPGPAEALRHDAMQWLIPFQEH